MVNTVETFYRDFECSLENFSLFTGEAGAVFIQSLSGLTGNTADMDPALFSSIRQNIDHIIKVVENSDDIEFNHCSGLSGIGWLMAFLCEKNMLDESYHPLLKDIDVFLTKALDYYFARSEYDLLFGYLGIGIYFLRRKVRRGNVCRIINHLREKAERIGNEWLWRRYSANDSTAIYDMGLAHGNAGILYFLGKCYQAGIKKKECRQMARGIIRFYLNKADGAETLNGACFPHSIPCAEYGKTPQKSFSRLAWCYGDLGVLYTLYTVTEWLDLNGSLKQHLLSMLIQSSKRLTYDQTGINEISVCHGTSGAGLLFLLPYDCTGEVAFKIAASHWLRESVLLLEQKKERLFKKRIESNDEFSGHYDLLNGLSGCAVLLLIQQYPDMLRCHSDLLEALFLG
ncbi:lanthionine synthetase LanC family protein [Chitinophaga sp. HK235]|uniref:lanthionine synthetase LanC family protein n=1 Tax=Chitinophaga sp. HK235 TaxID=2952571 RepID=UPI001BA58CA1|nr:lanthionine synthetase LanC family protein [Chitinophaga sp. HK235]